MVSRRVSTWPSPDLVVSPMCLTIGEPGCQSVWWYRPQYCRVNSGSVVARQSRSGVVLL